MTSVKPIQAPLPLPDNAICIPHLTVQQIMELIPHRYPMLLIDAMKDLVLDHSAIGIKNVSMNEWYFQGHFPEAPVMPGVLIVEAMAQTAGALVMKTLDLTSSGKLVYFMSIEDAKFRKPVNPGDVLELRVFKIQHRRNVWRFRGEAWVGNTLTDEATFTAMIADKPN